jgi:intracellular sulfur oxidation DsrE/DsrF family protein
VAKISDCSPKRPYALGNIVKVIEDYEVTHGMKPGRDYDIVAVVHSGGGHLMVQDQYAKPALGNQYEALVRMLLSKGVKFYYCQNTVRSFMSKGLLPPNAATQAIIPGVQYVTAGITALADFQSQGYTYVQP